MARKFEIVTDDAIVPAKGLERFFDENAAELMVAVGALVLLSGFVLLWI